VAAVNQIEISA